MDEIERRRILLEEYKNRRPEMGVICFRCVPTDDAFFYPSKDTKADKNSNRFKLASGFHPNRQLLALWKEHGEAQFELSVAQVLEYDEKEPDKDYVPELEALCAGHMARAEKGHRLKK